MLAESLDSGEVFDTLINTENLAEKYGFTGDEITEFQTEYENDTSIQQMIIDEMTNMCPELLE